MFITKEEVKALSSFPAVHNMEDERLDNYITRADSWIKRATNSPLIDLSTDVVIQADLKTATWMLVEYLSYWDEVETKEEAFSGENNVRMGSYSYSLNPEDGNYHKTGLKEIDGIMERWRYNYNIGNLFRRSGPSRK